MGTTRELRTWQDVGAAHTGEASGWFAAIAVIAVVLGTLFLLATSAAQSPPSFEDVSQLTQGP